MTSLHYEIHATKWELTKNIPVPQESFVFIFSWCYGQHYFLHRYPHVNLSQAGIQMEELFHG